MLLIESQELLVFLIKGEIDINFLCPLPYCHILRLIQTEQYPNIKEVSLIFVYHIINLFSLYLLQIESNNYKFSLQSFLEARIVELELALEATQKNELRDKQTINKLTKQLNRVSLRQIVSFYNILLRLRFCPCQP